MDVAKISLVLEKIRKATKILHESILNIFKIYSTIENICYLVLNCDDLKLLLCCLNTIYTIENNISETKNIIYDLIPFDFLLSIAFNISINEKRIRKNIFALYIIINFYNSNIQNTKNIVHSSLSIQIIYNCLMNVNKSIRTDILNTFYYLNLMILNFITKSMHYDEGSEENNYLLTIITFFKNYECETYLSDVVVKIITNMVESESLSFTTMDDAAITELLKSYFILNDYDLKNSVSIAFTALIEHDSKFINSIDIDSLLDNIDLLLNNRNEIEEEEEDTEPIYDTDKELVCYNSLKLLNALIDKTIHDSTVISYLTVKDPYNKGFRTIAKTADGKYSFRILLEAGKCLNSIVRYGSYEQVSALISSESDSEIIIRAFLNFSQFEDPNIVLSSLISIQRLFQIAKDNSCFQGLLFAFYNHNGTNVISEVQNQFHTDEKIYEACETIFSTYKS